MLTPFRSARDLFSSRRRNSELSAGKAKVVTAKKTTKKKLTAAQKRAAISPGEPDAFAVDREVILFDNAGVASSSGTVPDTIEAMARDAITFIDANNKALPERIGFLAYLNYTLNFTTVVSGPIQYYPHFAVAHADQR